jgi:single-stranded-DNA-specific exonuclease
MSEIATTTTARQKRWRTPETNAEIVCQLQQALGIHPIFCTLLAQRGITTFDEARRFFRPEWSHLHDPFLMKDMEKAVARLSAAIQKGEKILLYGDYDVDGTTSIALLYSFLIQHHKNLDYYIPDRYKEGYGVSSEGIWYAHEQGVNLIITLDCGITAINQVKRANELGIAVIICDHHLPEATLPAAVAVLDAKRSDCTYPFKELSGCGVAFKLAQAYVRAQGWNEDQLLELTDFLAVSIACDIVPIVDENRTLAWLGMQQLNRTQRPGLKALIDLSKRPRPLTVSDVVFGLGPMINAAGRLADAHQAVRMLLSGDANIAYDYGRVLETRNKLRKEFDQRIFQEARELFLQDPRWQERKSIVLYQPHWHKGIVGIVASRMVEAFHRPTIILTNSDNKVAGSARSVNGFDIHHAIGQCRDLLLSYGGHAHAAGLSLRPEDFSFFQDRLEAVVTTHIAPETLEPEIEVACDIDLKEITPGFWKILRQFAPFGPGNHNPTFVARSVQDIGYSKLLTGNHLRLCIKQADSTSFLGVAFGRGDDFTKVRTRQPFDLCFNLQENHWNEMTSLQLVVKDMQFGKGVEG